MHLGLAGFVVSLTARPVPLLPNAARLAADRLETAGLRVGMAAAVGPDGIAVGPLRVAWDAAEPPVWDPRLRPVAPGGRGMEALARLSERLPMETLSVAGSAAGARGIALLRAAVSRREPATATAAAEVLVGRGPGLTPEGDDLLAAAALAVRALAPAADMDADRAAALAGALCPTGVEERTTLLSATLLRLAAVGCAPEAVQRLLGGGSGAPALGELLSLGQSTGRAYATGLGSAAHALVALPSP